MSNFTCPSCRTALQIDPLAPPASCPECGATIRIGEGISAGLPPEGSDRPFRMSSARYDDGGADVNIRAGGGGTWRAATIGVHFIFWSMLAMFVLGGIVQLMQIAFPMDPNQPPAPGRLAPMMFVVMGAGCLVLVAVLLFIVGLIMCCFAPDASASRSAITAVVALAIAIILGIVFFVIFMMAAMDLGQQGGPPPQNPQVLLAALMNRGGVGMIVLGGLMLVTLLVYYFSWLYFHVAVANAFNDRSLRALGITNIVVYPIILVAGIGIQLVPLWVNVDPIKWIRIQSAVSVVIMCIQYGLYLPLAWRTIKTIERGTGGQAYAVR